MKRKFVCIFLTMVVIMSIIPLGMINVVAAAPAIKVPAKMYPISTYNNTPAYSTRGGSQTGTIYADDLCTLKSVCDDEYGIFEYPITIGGGTRTLYAKLSSFFTTTNFVTGSITKYATVYRRSSGSAILGSVDAYDTSILVFGSEYGRTQILYSVTGYNYYKVGWVDSSAVRITTPFITTLSVSANRYSGTTNDKYDFYATTNIAVDKVILQFNGNYNEYKMNSYDNKNWSLLGNSLNAGNRTITITAYPSIGWQVTKTLSISVTQPSYQIYGGSNIYLASDIAASTTWGTESYGVRVYAAEHGNYAAQPTGYNANFLVYKDKNLVAVFTKCSTLPDNSKSTRGNDNMYPAVVKDNEYSLKFASTYRNSDTPGPYYKVRYYEYGLEKDVPCLRWNGYYYGNSTSKIGNIELHYSGDKTSYTYWSTGCLNIYKDNQAFYDHVGTTQSGVIKIVRDTPIK